MPAPVAPMPAPLRRTLILRLDIRISSVEQLFGGVDAAWIRRRVPATVADIEPEARAAGIGWPRTYSPVDQVQEIDGGYRVTIAWAIDVPSQPGPVDIERWRYWLERRLRRTQHGDRIRAVRMTVQP